MAVERPKAMHARNMFLSLCTVFFIAAAFVWATYDPDLASGERSELMVAFNRTNTLVQQGRYSEAEPYAKEALRLGTEELGRRDPAIVTLLDNLADLHRAQGRYAEAEPLYKRSLAIKEKTLGPGHPDVAASLEIYDALRRQITRAGGAESMAAPANATRATDQDLAASDIVNMITTYHENESIFESEYLGKTLMSTMYFDAVRGEVFGGGYFVGFDGESGSAGLTCRFTRTLPNEILDWDAGKSVDVTGVVYGVVLSTLFLKRCRFE
jgi:tetratricopeptide (TPR) repeat protein